MDKLTKKIPERKGQRPGMGKSLVCPIFTAIGEAECTFWREGFDIRMKELGARLLGSPRLWWWKRQRGYRS